MDDRAAVNKTLPPLNVDAVCPKCGFDDIAMHHRNGDECNHGACDWHEQEHILRVCQRCRYDWPEATILEEAIPKHELILLPTNPETSGAWFVFGIDTMAYPVGLYQTELEALRSAEMFHFVVFWEFGKTWDQIKGIS